jgi:NADH dehydrogenase [ubiquinone] 1 alpha subcomplex assembly factor 7
VSPVLILAHEFFDALPVMIFEKTESGWVEKIVDNNVDTGAEYTHNNSSRRFQLANSEPNNPNVKKILNPYHSVAKDIYSDTIQNGDRIEISPKAMVMMNSFAELIMKIGGGVLAIDYGDTFGFSDSIRVVLL